MNNGNPIEETHTNEASDDLNLKRRRLIRGALGVAPMVLTLRSGTLAAASCTGALVLTQTSNPSGKLDFTGEGIIKEGDKCVTYNPTGASNNECLTTYPPIAGIGGKISTGDSAGQVTGSGTNWFCGDVTTPNQPVAILSAASLTSLLHLPLL